MAATLDIEQLRKILADMSQAIVDAKEELSEADRETGDGDHGSGMARGFSAARDAVLAADLKTAGDAFRAACEAVWLHGDAARRALPAFIADDLLATLPAAIAARL